LIFGLDFEDFGLSGKDVKRVSGGKIVRQAHKASSKQAQKWHSSSYTKD
jgi:hypothetical protein